MSTKLSFFDNEADVLAYITTELVATLHDDADDCEQARDLAQANELRAKIDDIEAVTPMILACAEPRFMYVWDTPDTGVQADFATLSSMLEANADDSTMCDFVKHANVGNCYKTGGGASPVVTTWRVS